ncbi:MAG: hypothetical protein WC479_04555 [Candidatus Izemoplasmatales bacterium]
MSQPYPNIFKNKYHNLRGKDWVKYLSEEDRKIFSEIGRAYANHGHDGWVACASSILRDEKGRFKKK